MTIICAAKGPDGIWIGSDTECRIGDRRMPTAPKWAFHNGRAIGISGLHRGVDLAKRYADSLLSDDDAWRASLYLCKLLQEDGWQPDEKEKAIPTYELWGIAILGGQIYRVAGDCHFSAQPGCTYFAGGSGMDFALGAMLECARSHDEPALLVERGLEAAIALDSGCGGEPWVKKLA